MKNIILYITVLISLNLFAQETSNEINWLTIEEALQKQKENPRKIIIDAYTDWCGWCKHYDQTTFRDQGIIQYINANFYAVKFNAETLDTIEYRGKKYYNEYAGKLDQYGRPIRRPTHQLAFELMNNKMSYPTLIYLDDSAKVIAPISGYFSAFDIQPMLIYFAEDLYLSVNLQDFINNFKKTFVDSLKSNKQNIKWLSINEALEKSKTEPRKIIISFDSPWTATSKVMFETTFNDSAVANYINENMYAVKFDVLSQDSVVFSGYTFKNQNSQHPYHDFAVQLLNGNMRLPATVFLSEDLRPITNTPGYFTTEAIIPVLQYFNRDFYKTTPWIDFSRNYPQILENKK